MTKLHIGCGPEILKGWINIDNQQFPGVDYVMDVTKELPPVEDVSHIFAEHFIEHLAYPDAVELLRNCRRILRDDGVLRLSTPNLDWVWMTHYRLGVEDPLQVQACFGLNRAFRGWGHQFLWNERTLAATLLDAGFGNVVRCEYGQSTHPELRKLERHEKSPDYGSLSHILIVEASGRGNGAPDYLAPWRGEYLRDIALR